MKNDTSLFSLRNIKILTNMQKKIFLILVQTALNVGLIWRILKLTSKSALLSLTILYIRAKLGNLIVVKTICNFLTYRVSHSKPSKVILLWWRYRLWFLLIFWILRVHEKGTFMPNSSVFIFLMLRAIYGSISQNLLSLINFELFWLLGDFFK